MKTRITGFPLVPFWKGRYSIQRLWIRNWIVRIISDVLQHQDQRSAKDVELAAGFISSRRIEVTKIVHIYRTRNLNKSTLISFSKYSIYRCIVLQYLLVNIKFSFNKQHIFCCIELPQFSDVDNDIKESQFHIFHQERTSWAAIDIASLIKI